MKVTCTDGTEIAVNEQSAHCYTLLADNEYTIKVLPLSNNQAYVLLVESLSGITTEGKNIYYVGNLNLNTNGCNIFTKTENIKAQWLTIPENTAYYSAYGNLYKLENDVETKILENVEAMFIVSKGEYVYFSDMRKDGRIYRCDKDGGNLTKLTDSSASWLYIKDDFLYYTDNRDGRIKKQILIENIGEIQ